MVKRHIHHFSRGVVIVAELLGVAVIAVFAAWLLLIICLSQGPMNVDFLTRTIEKGINAQQTGFEFSVGSTLLAWGGTNQPFEFAMSDVRVFRTDKTPVLSVKRVGVQLSKRHLVFGALVPRVIRIYRPALRVIRAEDGRFLLNVRDLSEIPEAEPEFEPGSESADISDFMRGMIAALHSGTGLLAGLQQVSVADAALLYDDRILNVRWKSKGSSLAFSRGRGGLLVDVAANVAMNSGQPPAALRGSFYYNWETLKPNGVVSFEGFNPALFVQQSEALKDLSGVDLPLKGSVSFAMDQDFRPGYGRFVLESAAEGKFNTLGLYDSPIPVKGFRAQGWFNAATREAQAERLEADLGGPKLVATAELRQKAEAGGHVLQLKAALQDMTLDGLKDYWPLRLAPDPRAWVTGHLSAGVAPRATLDLSLLAPGGDFAALKLLKVGGQIDFTGIKVDYFPPLMPVTKVDGKATYDNKSFTITVNGGTLGDMRVTGGKVAITDIDIQDEDTHAKIDIDADVEGPLQTALKVLDGEPLGYPRKLGLKPAETEGKTFININFKFPLYNLLKIEEINVTAQAKLNEAKLPAVVSGLDLTGGPVDVSLKNGLLGAKGTGQLGGMAVAFDWSKDFSEQAEVSSKVEAVLPLDASALEKFGLPADFRMAGTLPADVTYTLARDGTASLLFKGDITPAAFTIPIMNYEKKEGAPGSLDLVLHFGKDGALAKVSSLNLQGEGVLLQGELEMGPGGKSLKTANFKQVRLGGTDIALEAENRGAAEGYLARITGRQFDASALLADDGKPNSDEAAGRPVTPLTVSMAVGSLLTGKEKSIDQVKLFLRRNGWSRIEQLEVDGQAGGKPLFLRYMPSPQGHTLRFEADNAGAALRAFGITNGMRGGKLSVSGQPLKKGGPRDLSGTVTVTDFTLVDVPVLARILNAMSLTGIVELLNGKGIAFKKARADYQWIDRGQPETARNSRLIKVRDGETSGASLGLTFQGSIDNWKKSLDLDGTIIPVSDLNKVLDSIPLFGDILTGGGKGVFAATYTIKGPKDQPTVTVNPLAVLAPGIFRKLFFEK